MLLILQRIFTFLIGLILLAVSYKIGTFHETELKIVVLYLTIAISGIYFIISSLIPKKDIEKYTEGKLVFNEIPLNVVGWIFSKLASIL